MSDTAITPNIDWIPVTERLPKMLPGGNYSPDVIVQRGGAVHVAYLYRNIDWRCAREHKPLVGVTAWFPMPGETVETVPAEPLQGVEPDPDWQAMYEAEKRAREESDARAEKAEASVRLIKAKAEAAQSELRNIRDRFAAVNRNVYLISIEAEK